MTRKHFTAIAARIARERDAAHGLGEGTERLDRLAYGLAFDLAAMHPTFDRVRFLAAAGVRA